MVDGANQSAFGLPNFVLKTIDDRGYVLNDRRVELLEYGKPNRISLLKWRKSSKTGANDIIEAIPRFINNRVRSDCLSPPLYV